MAIITLTTDFGVTDSFVGAMKGVILSIAPGTQIVDLCHEIPPQDVLAGALILEEAYSFFPAGTIHLAVVDPGVGSARAALGIRAGRFHFVGPDNGIFDLCLNKERAQAGEHFHAEFVQLTNPGYRLKTVSSTFHGRDIFAPAAASVANGTSIVHMGEHMEFLETLSMPEPILQDESVEAHVLRADRFGNLVTDLMEPDYRKWNPSARPVSFAIAEKSFAGLRQTFSDVPRDEPLAYFGSSARLEIGINHGNAKKIFNVSPGASVMLQMTK